MGSTELIRRRMMGTRGSSIDWESIARGMVDKTTVFNADVLLVGATEISSYLFYGRDGLQSVEIPNTVTVIRDSAFSYCTGLTTIIIPDSVTTVGQYVLQGCSKVTSLVFPNSVTNIGNQCCRSMSELETVDIGTGITTIYNMAFYQCSKIQYYIFRATTPPTLGSSALAGVSGYAIYVPDASVNTYKAASGWSSYASKILPISDLKT